MSYTGSTRESYVIALEVEKSVAIGLKGRLTPWHHPFDVIVDDVKAAIEVKTKVRSCRGRLKVTERAGARGRKTKYLAEKKLCAFTLAVDCRGRIRRYFLREGCGSYYLEYMTPYSNLKQVRRHLARSYRRRVR